jgi:hypothetical protein
VKTIQKSAKLNNVCYDIRGPVLEKAKQMEEDGHKIIKLNIGNLAPFGFDAPEEIQLDMIRNLPNSAGYSDSKGIFAARKAVMHYTQEQGIKNVIGADFAGDQRAARSGRRAAPAGARLPAVDRGDQPFGRHASALLLR